MKELVTLFTKDNELINLFNELNLEVKHYDHAAVDMIADFTGLTFIDFESEEFIKLNDVLCKLGDIQRIVVSDGRDIKFLKEHQASSVGAEGYLKKPLTSDLLLDIINEFSNIQKAKNYLDNNSNDESTDLDLNLEDDNSSDLNELKMATEVRELITDHNNENTQFFNLIDSNDNQKIQRNFDLIFGENTLYNKLSVSTDSFSDPINVKLHENDESLDLKVLNEGSQNDLTIDSVDSDDLDFDLSVDFDSDNSNNNLELGDSSDDNLELGDSSENNFDLDFDVDNSDEEFDDSNLKLSLVDENKNMETLDDEFDLNLEDVSDTSDHDNNLNLSKENNSDELSFDLSDTNESEVELASDGLETLTTEKLNSDDDISFDLSDDKLTLDLSSEDDVVVENLPVDSGTELIGDIEDDNISFELGAVDIENHDVNKSNSESSFLQKRDELAEYLDEETIGSDKGANYSDIENDLTNENITAEFDLTANVEINDIELNKNIDLSVASLDDVENNFDEDELDIYDEVVKEEKVDSEESLNKKQIFEVKVNDNIVDKESFTLDDEKSDDNIAPESVNSDHTVTATSTVTKHLRSFDVTDQNTLDINANELLNGLGQDSQNSFKATNDENIFLKYKEDEIVRLTHLINDLKNERSIILTEVNDLNDKVSSYKRSDLSFRTELDELKVENRVLKRRYEEDFQSFNFNFKKLKDELTIKSEKIKLLNEDFEALRSTSFIDIQRVKEKEKSLESKLELINIDSSSQIKLREQRILDLKRTVDQLEFNMETLLINEQKLKTENLELSNQLDRVMNSLKGSIQNIEQGHEFIEFRGNKNKDDV